jgi:hypothetical protein
MSEPRTPAAWANRLSRLLAAALGDQRFPVDVERLALEYTREVFEDPITKVIPAELRGFEGALYRSPSGKARWCIVYNQAIESPGRIRFTLGHELGHYLLHRAEREAFECTPRDMARWREDDGRRELEANRFASYLLMPIDDFRRQVDGQALDLDLFQRCADRYGVSLMAAILKWLEFTPRRAILVVTRDSFIDWAVSSTPALRSGRFFRTRNQSPIEVPRQSLAGVADPLQGHEHERDHPPGVWFQDEPVSEIAVISDRFEMTMSLLLLPDVVPYRGNRIHA